MQWINGSIFRVKQCWGPTITYSSGGLFNTDLICCHGPNALKYLHSVFDVLLPYTFQFICSITAWLCEPKQHLNRWDQEIPLKKFISGLNETLNISSMFSASDFLPAFLLFTAVLLSGFRIFFSFVSFSHGIPSHLSLRNHNDRYLRETKGVLPRKEGCGWLVT